MRPRELLRRKGTPYDELGLDDPKWTDDELIAVMLAHPILINRPIVVTPKGVRLCRPSEIVPQSWPSKTVSSVSSSIPFTSPVSRLTRASTSSRPKSPTCPRSRPCASTKNSQKSSALSPASKTFIEMRPIHHRTADRVQAHIFVASLALLIHRAIEKKLKAAGLDLSATEALFALKSLRVVDIALADGSTKRCVTQPTQRVAAILRALGISAIKPPTPPQHDKIIL